MPPALKSTARSGIDGRVFEFIEHSGDRDLALRASAKRVMSLASSHSRSSLLKLRADHDASGRPTVGMCVKDR